MQLLSFASITVAAALFNGVQAQFYSNTTTSDNSTSSAPTSSSGTYVPTVTPSFIGQYNGGSPKWILTIPGALGDWSNVDVDFALTAGCSFTGAIITVDGVDQSAAASTNLSASYASVSIDFSVDGTSDLVIELDGAISAGDSWTVTGSLEITLPDLRLAKRAVLTYDIAATITPDGAALSTSTATESDISTTIVTVTSCSDDVCTLVPVTTGVVVVSTTESGIVTDYTTYCPLTETSKGPGPSTTVVTITSCSNDVCTLVPVTSTIEESTSTATKAITSTVEGTSAAVSTYEGVAAAQLAGGSVIGLVVAALFI